MPTMSGENSSPLHSDIEAGKIITKKKKEFLTQIKATLCNTG